MSGVKVRTNVLCVKMSESFVNSITCDDNSTVPTVNLPNGDKDIIRRLNYWDLLALRNIAPLRFNFDRDELTGRQKAERDAFIREGDRGPWA
jgi:hypothetical protein